MKTLSLPLGELQKKIRENDNTEKIYLTSKNSPELKAAMNQISAELLKRNKNLYRRLANEC